MHVRPQGQTTGTGGPPPGPEQPASPQQSQPVAHSGGPSGPRANFGQRLLGLIIDGLVLAVPSIVLFLILDPGIAYLLSILATAAYYIVLEGGPTGQTLGKKICNIRVVDQPTLPSNRAVGVGRGIGRYFAVRLSGHPVRAGLPVDALGREQADLARQGVLVGRRADLGVPHLVTRF